MIRILRVFRLAAIYLLDFARANLLIARQVLSRDLGVSPEVIEVESQAESPGEVLMMSNMITFTPGTLTLDVEPGRKLTVHALNDGAGARRTIQERLEAPLLRITRKSPDRTE